MPCWAIPGAFLLRASTHPCPDQAATLPLGQEVSGVQGLCVGATCPRCPPGNAMRTDVSEPAKAPEVWHASRELSSDAPRPSLSCTCPQAARMPTQLHAKTTLLTLTPSRLFLPLRFQALDTSAFCPQHAFFRPLHKTTLLQRSQKAKAQLLQAAFCHHLLHFPAPPALNYRLETRKSKQRRSVLHAPACPGPCFSLPAREGLRVTKLAGKS